MNLTKLANKYKTDKGYKHHYTEIYQKIFNNLRFEYFNFLEIGFGEGASAKMWLDYFPNAAIYFIDIIKKIPKDFKKMNRFRFINANQASISQLCKIFDINVNGFKIIIDDGSHITKDQLISFWFLFHVLHSEGFYVIEDLNYKHETNLKMIDILKNWIKNDKIVCDILEDSQADYLSDHIESIDIYKEKIAFIRKK